MTNGTHDIVFLVLNDLRYDVAAACLVAGSTPTLQRYLLAAGRKARHAPGVRSR